MLCNLEITYQVDILKIKILEDLDSRKNEPKDSQMLLNQMLKGKQYFKSQKKDYKNNNM